MKAKRRMMNAVLRILRLLNSGMTHAEVDRELQYGVKSADVLKTDFARKVRELFEV